MVVQDIFMLFIYTINGQGHAISIEGNIDGAHPCIAAVGNNDFMNECVALT